MLRLTRLFVPVMVMLALIAAPFTAPQAANAMARDNQPVPASMANMDMAGMDMAAMDSSMGDMPCCPSDEAPAPDCAKACPLMMLCMAKCFQGTGSANPTHITYALAGFLIPGNDEIAPGLSQSPPARPPRT